MSQKFLPAPFLIFDDPEKSYFPLGIPVLSSTVLEEDFRSVFSFKGSNMRLVISQKDLTAWIDALRSAQSDE